MFIWAAKIRPKVANPNIVTFNAHKWIWIIKIYEE